MNRFTPIAAALLLLVASPALALDASASSVTCAAAVTKDLGTPHQTVKDESPSDLPVLAYRAEPKDGEFKSLTRIAETPIRLYVYRVNDKLLHMQIFEQGAEGRAVLADTPLTADIGEMTYRSIGSSQLVTVYCY